MSPSSRARRLHVMLNSGASPARPLTVFKIGGSLFDLPELPQVIETVLNQRRGNAALVVAGGGAAADVVRGWDRMYKLGDAAAHALALAATDLTTALLAHFLPGARLVRSEQQLRMAAGDHAVALLCADCFIKAAEAQGHPPLEQSWRVTGDSIAAWTAHVVDAVELVLVKSVPAPRGMDAAAAARAGLVDDFFPDIARQLPSIGWVNGRSLQPLIESWPGSPL